MIGKIILLVEDDQDIREALVDLLQEEGYQVLVAENGQVALDKLSKMVVLPNVILLDLMMPVKDGFQFCLEKEANAKFSHIPVVVMSADGRVSENQKRLNVPAYLKKPLDIYQVIDVVQRFSL